MTPSFHDTIPMQEITMKQALDHIGATWDKPVSEAAQDRIYRRTVRQRVKRFIAGATRVIVGTLALALILHGFLS